MIIWGSEVFWQPVELISPPPHHQHTWARASQADPCPAPQYTVKTSAHLGLYCSFSPFYCSLSRSSSASIGCQWVKWWDCHISQACLSPTTHQAEHSSSANIITRPISRRCLEELIPLPLHLLPHVLEGVSLHVHRVTVTLAVAEHRHWSVTDASTRHLWTSLEHSRNWAHDRLTAICTGLGCYEACHWSADTLLRSDWLGDDSFSVEGSSWRHETEI